MNLLREMSDFFAKFFSKRKNKMEKSIDSEKNVEELEMMLKDCDDSIAEEKLNMSKRSILAKLYSLEQTLNVLEMDYKEKYDYFMQKIDKLRNDYHTILEESKKNLTFEINPNVDIKKVAEVSMLEDEINKFIEQDVKYDILSKKLEKLVLKLNILYNISIYHPEKYSSVIDQMKNALNYERELFKAYKEWSTIIGKEDLKERMFSLFSYADYLRFESCIRNSESSPEDFIDDIIIVKEFNGVEINSVFRDFMLDEISELIKLLPLIKEGIFNLSFKDRIRKINEKVIKDKNCILNYGTWDELFKIETEIIDFLIKENGIDKGTAKIGLFKKMNIKITEDEVFISPKSNTILSLASIYSGVKRNDSILMMKILNVLSDKISYKEIYLLLVLFDLLHDVKSTENDLLVHVEKYIKKYPYSRDELNSKRNNAFKVQNKKYIFVFNLNQYEDVIIEKYLKKCNLDYIIIDSKVYLNTFYFEGLELIYNNIKTNAENMKDGGIICN